jgi:hypothetical protein
MTTDEHNAGAGDGTSRVARLLEIAVARLQHLEHEHRKRMRSYLTQQLAEIEPRPRS